MAAERKTGAGSYLSGVLERAPQPKPDPATVEPDPAQVEAAPKGRGVTPAPKPSRAPAARTAKRIKGRTVYLPDDLFERIIVQAHRKDLTISDYIANLLDRHVPDHRRVGPASIVTDQGEDAA
jgi:hypothetical protein